MASQWNAGARRWTQVQMQRSYRLAVQQSPNGLESNPAPTVPLVKRSIAMKPPVSALSRYLSSAPAVSFSDHSQTNTIQWQFIDSRSDRLLMSLFGGEPFQLDRRFSCLRFWCRKLYPVAVVALSSHDIRRQYVVGGFNLCVSSTIKSPRLISILSSSQCYRQTRLCWFKFTIKGHNACHLRFTWKAALVISSPTRRPETTVPAKPRKSKLGTIDILHRSRLAAERFGQCRRSLLLIETDLRTMQALCLAQQR